MSATIQTWEEKIGDQVFVFRGERDTSDQSKRVVVEIRSLVPLLKRQIAAGIPPPYRGAVLSRWDDSQSNPEAKLIVQHFLADVTHSIYINGEVGRGKTWVACCIGNELLQRGKAVRFQPLSELLVDVRDSYSHQEVSEKTILQPLRGIQFLILDELGDLAGNRERSASEFSVKQILALLDSRWQKGRHTIFTSNLDLDQLQRWAADPRIASRIAGACGRKGVFEITGRDLRVEEQVPCP